MAGSRKRLTKNQKEYHRIIHEAEEQHINVQGLIKLPKRITQKTLQELRSDIKNRSRAQVHSVTDEVISKLRGLPSKQKAYTRDGEVIYYNIEQFYYMCLTLIKRMQEDFGVSDYEEYLSQNEEELMSALDDLYTAKYAEEIEATIEKIYPILSNRDMSKTVASLASDYADYFNGDIDPDLW